MSTYGKSVPIECCAVRVTRCASDGTTPAGSNGIAVTELIGKVTIKPVYEAGTEFNPKTACGALAITYKDRDIPKRIDIDFDMMGTLPELEEILTGGALVTDGVPKSIGRSWVPTGAAPPGNGVCIEAWAKNIPAFTGYADATRPWVRFVIARAFMQDVDKNLDLNPFTNSFTGFGVENASIGNGPLNDFPASITPFSRCWTYFLDTSLPSTTSSDYQSTPAQV